MTEEIERYKEKREKFFWEFFGISVLIGSLILVGCTPVRTVQGIPEPYNLTLMGNATGIVGLTQLVNTNLMFGYFGIGVMLSVFVITFFSFMFKTANPGTSFAASAFITFAMSILLRGLNIVPDVAMWASLAIAAISVAFVNMSD